MQTISGLPSPMREKAEKYQKDIPHAYDQDKDTINSFKWDKTLEGQDFWQSMGSSGCKDYHLTQFLKLQSQTALFKIY